MRAIITLAFAALTSLAALACAHAGSRDLGVDVVTPSEVVNLNTASEGDLIALPGVGPTKAAAIIEYRKKHGGFTRIEDLNKVKGFGRKTVAKLRPTLSVDPAPASKTQ